MAKQRPAETTTVAPAQAPSLPATALTVIDQPQEPIGGMVVSSPAAAAFLKAVEGPRQTIHKLPIITIDHKGGTFLLPSGELVEAISGYPIYFFRTRAWYKAPYKSGESGKPPDCWSPDMVNSSPSSSNRQQEFCIECPKAQWGSARDERGQACATKLWLFLLNGAFGNPPIAVLVVPPSSLKVLLGSKFSGGYLNQCQARAGGVYEIVWSTFRLAPVGAQDSPTHHVLAPEMGKVCDDVSKCERIAKVRNDFIRLMEELRGATPDVAGQTEE